MERSRVNVLILSDAEGYRAYRLDRSIYFVGRSQKADIQVFDNKASRIHSTFIRMGHLKDGHHYRLVDGDARTGTSSQNGTYLNGRVIASKHLRNNDRIAFGGPAQAFFLHLNSQFEYDLLTAPDRWLREQVNKKQEHDTLSMDASNQHALAKWRPNSLAIVEAAGREEENAQASGFATAKGSESAKSSEPEKSKLQLGQFFIRSAKIQEDQLQHVLRQKGSSGKRIGELLVEQGLVTELDVQNALNNQNVHLGEILVRRKLITAKQLQDALAQQISRYERIGEILLKEQLISPDELKDALHEQHLRQNGFWCLK